MATFLRHFRDARFQTSGEVMTLAFGQIRKIDPANRLAVIAFEDGRERTVTFTESANIEVLEPATMGRMGGTLEDLVVGYWVEAEVSDDREPSCSCASLVCVS